MSLRLACSERHDMSDLPVFPPIHQVDHGCLPLIADMMRNGMRVDVPYLQSLSAEWGERLNDLTTLMQAEVGRSFNPGSADQVASLLKNDLHLPLRKMTKGGEHKAPRPCVDDEVLESLESAHPIIPRLLEYREYQKLKGTYADSLALMAQADPRARIHTELKVTRTATGRLSSADPNLQNIPARTEEGKRIRGAFVAPRGKRLASIDLSQIEMRWLALESLDAALLRIFLNNLDIHAATAAEVAGIALEDVTKDMRFGAKAVNFGIVYGIEPAGLARRINKTVAEAADYIQAYLGRFPGVRNWIDNTKAHALDYGWVQCLFGRRRYLPEVFSPERWQVAEALRQAQNMPIQGGAQSYLKVAMADVYEQLPAWQFVDCLPLLQIHDELLFETLDSDAIMVGAVVKGCMEHAIPGLPIPIIAEVKIGERWSELEAVKL